MKTKLYTHCADQFLLPKAEAEKHSGRQADLAENDATNLRSTEEPKCIMQITHVYYQIGRAAQLTTSVQS